VKPGYIGRFAPSPTGPLHAGSLVAALASWLDARAQCGQWLVRIEDVDRTRCRAGLDRVILQQLSDLGLHSDQAPVYQSQRGTLYRQALDKLLAQGLAYPCGCTRKDIALTRLQAGLVKSRHSELFYPGTCRDGLHDKNARAWRFKTHSCIENKPLAKANKGLTAINIEANEITHWADRWRGQQQQDVATAVGDFILKRADGCFAYQLAVVVDDAAQGITDVVRGVDLADNTARQIVLQRALALPTPNYLHTPLVRGTNGEKLSKQNGAQAVDTRHPLEALNPAAQALGLSPQQDAAQALINWVRQWQHEKLSSPETVTPTAPKPSPTA